MLEVSTLDVVELVLIADEVVSVLLDDVIAFEEASLAEEVVV